MGGRHTFSMEPDSDYFGNSSPDTVATAGRSILIRIEKRTQRMGRAENDGDRDPESWLLETYRALQRTVTAAADATELGQRIPDALTEPAACRVAWIGTEKPRRIESRCELVRLRCQR